MMVQFSQAEGVAVAEAKTATTTRISAGCGGSQLSGRFLDTATDKKQQ